MKKLILVTSPPACGKTFISKQLAKALNHVVYLDKDTLIPLSKQIFAVAHQPYDRSSIFFEKYIRDLEYRVVLDLAMEALELQPIFLLGMRLGEGSGCPLAFQVLEAACAIINNMATFDQAGIDDGYLDEIREGDKFTVEAGV